MGHSHSPGVDKTEGALGDIAKCESPVAASASIGLELKPAKKERTCRNKTSPECSAIHSPKN